MKFIINKKYGMFWIIHTLFNDNSLAAADSNTCKVFKISK